MPDVLKGSLAQLPLPEVLRLLAAGGQTGRLDIHNGAKRGAVYLRQGKLVHAAEGADMGLTALNALTGWPQGDFNFVPNEDCRDESLTLPTEELISETAKRAEKWRQIRPLIPSTEAVFKMAPGGMHESVTLEPEDWRVLTELNGTLTLKDIANLLSQDELEVALILNKLAQAGLLEGIQKPQAVHKAIVHPSFFTRLNDEFVNIMGPLAPMIIDEAIAALGETREAFPPEKLPALIERISTEIDGTEKRNHFKEMMLGLGKKP